MYRNPVIAREEKHRSQAMFELVVDTAERYRQDPECDREPLQMIALDAKGVPQVRLTASHATRLLAEAFRTADRLQAIDNAPSANLARPAKSVAIAKTHAPQSVSVQH